MSLFFWIVVGAALGALVLGLILKVRLRDQQVWEELVDPDVSSNPLASESSRSPDAAERHDINMDEFDQPQEVQDEEMNTPPLSQSNRSVRDAELRRSSRIERPVSLVVLGTNRRGEIFQERTSAVAVNLHGCRYSSRHEYAPEGWVTLQITGTDGANSRPVRARVRSVFSPQSSRELCQVGVELETPGNVWGIPTPPEDWQRLLGISSSAFRTGAAVAPALETVPTHSSSFDRQSNHAERRAEVTVFPGPPATEDAPQKENASGKAERVVITAEQLLQALQGKLQLAAEKAVQVSLSAQLDDAVKAALGKIEEGWKTSVRQTEEFSSARLADTQTLWEKELHAYRDRAEDVARRIEALTALSQQALGDSQKFAERFAGETAPQLQARLNDSFARANSEFEKRAAEFSAQQLTQLTENAQRVMSEARSFTAAPADAVSQQHLESQLAAFRTETFDQLEKRLGELYSGFEQKLEVARDRTNDLARQLEGLALESRHARAQHEQGISEVRSLLSNTNGGIPQEQLNSQLNSSREQILSHLEWRLGEVSGHYDQLVGQTHNRVNELSQQIEKLSAGARSLAERAQRALLPEDLASIEQSVGHAKREFETVAARVSDRLLIRLMEQKQVVTQEASLELEARASEARALLQKASNSTLDDFRRRVESQVDQIQAEATERVSSSLASLDAESRATVEARRQVLEADVARAAEQSAMEFRSGIKAFLYSCLVAAVSAVDQHAQTTLAGLSNDPTNVQRALDNSANSSETPENSAFPPKAASSSE
jgi:hypothetical protein